MGESLHGIAQTQWILPVLFCVVFLDALLQCLPSATLVILTGLSAASGRIGVGWVIALVALAAYLGDNTVYRIGVRSGPRLTRWAQRTATGRRGYAWARRTMSRQPTCVIVLGRYMSGVRLAVMLTAGALRVPRFVGISGGAAALWASTTTLTGYLGGRVFAERPAAGLALAVAIGTAITVLTRLTMAITERAGGSGGGDPDVDPPGHGPATRARHGQASPVGQTGREVDHAPR